MQRAKKLLGRIGRHISVRRLLSITGKQLVLPFYHVVSDEHLPHVANLYQYRNTQQFEHDLDVLLQYFEPVSLEQLLKGGEKPASFQKPSFHLSFDDGLRECAEVIAPILLRKGIPATFFLNSGFIDNKGLFYRYKVSLIIEHINQNEISREELNTIQALMPEGSKQLKDVVSVKKLLLSLGYEHQFVINQIADAFDLDFGTYTRQHKPYLTKLQVQELINTGFTIGAHSIDHPNYNKLELIEQVEQTLDSVHYVREVFQVPYGVFAFPFTDSGVGSQFFNKMYPKGHQRLLDLSFGTAGLKQDAYPLHLQRIPMEDYPSGALQAIKSAYMTSAVQQSLGINRIKRR